jgi:hypothetical protein
MAEPSLPRNSELMSDKGQGSQPLMRFLDQVKKRAYTAIQSFNEFFSLDTLADPVDTANDYLMIYDASASAAKKVLADELIPSGDAVFDLIESWSATSTDNHVFSSISSEYTDLIISVTAVGGTAAVASLYVEVSDDNGSSYITGGGIYYALNAISSSTPIVNVTTYPGLAVFAYVRSGSDITSATFTLNDYTTTSAFNKRFEGAGGVTSTNGAAYTIGEIAGAGPINAIRVKVGSGNFRATGTVKLYGRK